MEIYILEEVDNGDDIVSHFSVLNVRDLKKSNTTKEFESCSSIMVTQQNNNHVICLEIDQFCTAIKRDVNNIEILGKCKCFINPHDYYLTLQSSGFLFMAPDNKN